MGKRLSGAKVCNYCRSHQELSNECLVFRCKERRRYSRERASDSAAGENTELVVNRLLKTDLVQSLHQLLN